MLTDGKTWQERQAEYEEFKKKCTCPICKKQVKEWSCFGTPLSGMISQGQWYCCRDHWMKDPNSSYNDPNSTYNKRKNNVSMDQKSNL